MRACGLLIAALACALLASCSKTALPADWPIKELTLPRNAQVVSDDEHENPLPPLYEEGSYWVVHFNCNLSWDQLKDHVEEAISPLGYKDLFEAAQEFVPTDQSGNLTGSGELDRFNKSYISTETHLQVMLANNEYLRQSMPGRRFADYTIEIVDVFAGYPTDKAGK
jgi:hypothetical protein